MQSAGHVQIGHVQVGHVQVGHVQVKNAVFSTYSLYVICFILSDVEFALESACSV